MNYTRTCIHDPDRFPPGWWVLSVFDPSQGSPGEDYVASTLSAARMLPPGIPYVGCWPVPDRSRALLLLPAAWTGLIVELANLLDPGVSFDSRDVWRIAADLAVELVRGGFPLASVAVYRSAADTWTNTAPARTALTPALLERLGKRPSPGAHAGHPLTGLLRIDAHGWESGR